MDRVVVVSEVGGPEVLRVEERDPAEPGPGQARIRVAAAGVNFIDVYFRTGLYPRPLPFAQGLEGAGRIEAVGEGVRDFAPGDRVAWASAPGSYADRIVAATSALVPVPDAVPDDIAAAAMLQGMTAHYLSHGVRETREGDVVLVHAAAGGTGLLLVQTLTAAGARVFGTCSTKEKAKLATEAGCEAVLEYGADLPDALREASGGPGAHAVYDSVGATTFASSLVCLRPRGLLALFGQASGPVPPFDLRGLGDGGSLFVTRPSLAHYIASRQELEHRAGAVLSAIAAGSLRVRIGGHFALDEAAAAHAALEGRGTSGKLLLLPQPEQAA